MSALPTRCDVTVIGAGPAGSAAAAMIRADGHSVCMVEKQSFPRFQIGESLLPRCMQLLSECGLLEAVLRRGYQRKNGAVFFRGAERSEFDFSDQHTSGWAHALQVPRADFDDVLARAAADRGARLFFDHSVSGFEPGERPIVTVACPDGSEREIESRFVVDASGYGRVLPRLLGLERPSKLPLRASLFSWIDRDVREPGQHAGSSWVAMHPDGAWLWVIPFSDGTASVGVVAEPEFFDAFPEQPSARLRAILDSEPNTAARTAGSQFVFEPKRIAGYSSAVSSMAGPGFCLVGNATEFLDPVFSSGLTLALESSVRAARVVCRKLGGESVDWEADYADGLQRGVDVFRHYVQAWYDGTLPVIFFEPDPAPSARRQICSVLAGHVWDETNGFVTQPARRLPQLVRLIGRRHSTSSREG